ncbi:hypothetical protein YPPY25_4916, partial [Yersinia pestis PY-25]|jgi:hypothetical protein
MVTG